MLKRHAVNLFIFSFALTAGFLIARVDWIRSDDLSSCTPDSASVRNEQQFPVLKTPELEMIEEVSYWLDENRPQPSMKLLEIGEGFHGDEVPAEDGDEWLGLFQVDNGYAVKRTKLKIKRVHDPVIDDEELSRTGKSVSVSSRSKPLFLVKGGESIRPGKASTFFRGLTDEVFNELQSRDITTYNGFTSLDKDYRDSFFTDDKREYELKVLKALNPEGKRILALSLESLGVRQILYTVRTWDEESNTDPSEWSGQVGTLFWVGDVDRDGKPDLYMELTAHENSIWTGLFLSSEAEEGKHVKLSAEFVITGC